MSYLYYLASAYGSATYNTTTYNGSSTGSASSSGSSTTGSLTSAAPTGSASATNSTTPGSLADTGVDSLIFMTIAAAIIFFALLVRVMKRRPKAVAIAVDDKSSTEKRA